MVDRAKVFRHGGSQAVRLPRRYRFDADEVEVHREGNRVVLAPVRKTWSHQFLELAGASPDFPDPEEPRLPPDTPPDLR